MSWQDIVIIAASSGLLPALLWALHAWDRRHPKPSPSCNHYSCYTGTCGDRGWI